MSVCVVFCALHTGGGDREVDQDPLAYRHFSPPRGADPRAGRWTGRRQLHGDLYTAAGDFDEADDPYDAALRDAPRERRGILG